METNLVTLAGSCLHVSVVSVAAVGGAVPFHEVCLLTTGFTSANLLTQRTVGGAGWGTGTPSGLWFTFRLKIQNRIFHSRLTESQTLACARMIFAVCFIKNSHTSSTEQHQEWEFIKTGREIFGSGATAITGACPDRPSAETITTVPLLALILGFITRRLYHTQPNKSAAINPAQTESAPSIKLWNLAWTFP